MTWRKRKSNLQKRKSTKLGKTLAEQELRFDSDGDEIMSLSENNKDEEAEIKALPLIDSSADLIEIDDIKADENDTLDQDMIFFLLIYYYHYLFFI